MVDGGVVKPATSRGMVAIKELSGPRMMTRYYCSAEGRAQNGARAEVAISRQEGEGRNDRSGTGTFTLVKATAHVHGHIVMHPPELVRVK